MPDLNLKGKEIAEIIECLKMQQDFINECEGLYKVYLHIKMRVERFCNKEFVSLDGSSE